MDLLELVKQFAQATEAAIGTENTTTLLLALTNFAKECPDTVQELQVLVQENPQVFSNMLTREGVMEAKEMIENISTCAPLIATFGI